MEDDRVGAILIAFAVLLGAVGLLCAGVLRSAVSAALESVALLTLDDVPPGLDDMASGMMAPGRRRAHSANGVIEAHGTSERA
jgi:hypothetical protein